MGKTSIKLIYWDSELNFGDALSPWLIQQMTGKKVIHKSHYSGLWISLKTLLYYLLKGEFSKISDILWPWEKNMAAIGSVLKYGNKRTIVWGSGYMTGKEKGCLPHMVYALRGCYSAKLLASYGGYHCNVFGDPAILLPLYLKGSPTKINSVGLIPHWKEFGAFNVDSLNCARLIDLRTDNIQKVVNEITECRYILSSSLHGLIVAHTYGIPALWVVLGDIGTDGIKFYDYFSSVGIPLYDGVPINEITDNFTNIVIDDIFKKYEEYILPHSDISIIQDGLLEAFPFKRLDKNGEYD